MISDTVAWLSEFSPMWLGVGFVGTGLVLAGVTMYRAYRKERDVNNK